MSNRSPARLTPRMILGLSAIAVGVLLTLRNVGVPGMTEPLKFWPLIIVAIGMNMAVRPRGESRRPVGILLILAGGWLLLKEFHVVRADLRDLWPLLLVYAGGYIIWQVRTGNEPKPGATADPGAYVRAFSCLGGIVRRSTSRSFRGADLSAVMGGCELDLTQASLGTEDAIIDTFTWWGGVEVRVPADWTVETRGIPIMGGFEDKTVSGGAGTGARLIVRGLAIMGGVEIKN